jgi:hypothetical protein
LLAYLDDTLEPTEIKQIGQKVAESDAAQELIARIKQVTRKRRLTTPPLTGPGAKFDPNLIADYLDNELSTEQVAEIEKVCLESDVHLAEIAACHQILTLVLGEPALVPPTARERMYGLVQGREAIPFRKAGPKPGVVKAGEADSETAVLGMPVHKRHAAWLKWAIPIAAVLLIGVLGFALYNALSSDNKPKGNQVASTDKANDTKDGKDKDSKDKDGKDKDKDSATKDKDSGKGKGGDKGKDLGKDNSGDHDKDGDKDSKDSSTKDKDGKDSGKDKDSSGKDKDGDKDKGKPPPKDPSKERKEIATYFRAPGMEGPPSILLARQQNQPTWTRLDPNKPVYSSDNLVSLPGYPSELRGKGVNLLLWGTMPEFNPNSPVCPFLYECSVTLHANPDGDLEFTLDRGRVYLTNPSGDKPARARVRFLSEIWDVTLQPESEVVIELIKWYTPNLNYFDEDSRADLTLYVLKGRAGLKHDGFFEVGELQGPTGKALVSWDNKALGLQGPHKIEQPIPVFAKDFPSGDEAKQLRPALSEIADRMIGKQPVEVVLVEGAKTGKDPSQRRVCTYCLGAVGAVPALLDLLGNEDPKAGPDREAALLTLRYWAGRGPEATKMLFDPKSREGLLVNKGYKANEADTVLLLLHSFTETARTQRATFEFLANLLRNKKIGIRELAFFHLRSLSSTVKSLPPYDPSWPDDKLDKSARDWEAMIERKELPPRPMGPPMGPPMGGPSPSAPK